MSDTIYYAEDTVTDWVSSIATTFDGCVLQAAKDNTTTSYTVTSYVGSNITLNSVTGLFVGSYIYFTVLSGTAPPELAVGYEYKVASISGNVITIHSSHDPPTAVILLSVSTCSLVVTQYPLHVNYPKAAWDYYRLQLYQSGNVNTIPLLVATSWYGYQQTVELTTAAFTRGTTTTNPSVVSHWAIVDPVADAVIGAIALDPTITITSTQTVTFAHTILTQPVRIH